MRLWIWLERISQTRHLFNGGIEIGMQLQTDGRIVCCTVARRFLQMRTRGRQA